MKKIQGSSSIRFVELLRCRYSQLSKKHSPVLLEVDLLKNLDQYNSHSDGLTDVRNIEIEN